MSETTEKQPPRDELHDENISEATPVEEDGVAPLIHPGDHRNPNDPRLPLVSPIVDGGNM